MYAFIKEQVNLIRISKQKIALLKKIMQVFIKKQ